jgi:hypothetical protein
MAYAVLVTGDDCRSDLVAHVPCYTVTGAMYMYAFNEKYNHQSIAMTTEARKRYNLHVVNMTDILPAPVQKYIDVAESLARDNHPMIRVLKECGLHKEMLFSTPVMVKTTKQIVGVLLAYDEVPEELCPAPGHLLNTHKTGFLTSLFHKSSPALKRLWTLNGPAPKSPNPSEKSVEYVFV